jgi:hypothetical protein
MTDPTKEEAPAAPNLTLQDLTLVVQLLQVGAQRGAWKAEELSTVGALYDKLVVFLTAAGVIQPKAEAENT